MKHALTRQFQEALDSYSGGYMVVQKLADGSRIEYETDVAQCLSWLQVQGVEELQKITHNHITNYIAQCKDSGLSGATLRKKIIILKTFFSWLCASDFIATDPTAPVIPPLREDKKPRVLSPDECHRLLACLQHPRDAAIIQVLLHTGITLSELMKVALADVSDLNVSMRVTPGVFGKTHVSREATGSLHIRGKGSRDRTIPLNRGICEALIAYLEKRPDSLHNTLFLSSHRRPLSDRQYQYIVEKYLAAARIPDAGVQTLRHTFAIQKLHSGTSPETLMELMGLKSENTIKLYLQMLGKPLPPSIIID